MSRSDAIERDTKAIGEEIFARLKAKGAPPLRPSWWDEKLLEWCLQDEALKRQVFCFIDVLPTLKTSEQVARHLQEYFLHHKETFPTAMQWGLHFASPRSPTARAVALAARRNAKRMAQRFIAGATTEEALAAIDRLRRQKLAFSLDILGEATVSEKEAQAYMQRYLDLLEALAPHARKWPLIELIDQDHKGPIPRISISVKLTALYSQLDPIDPLRSSSTVKERLRPILRRAREIDASVTLDMEQYHYKNLTLQIFKEILEEKEFRDWVHGSIALQAYLKDSEKDLWDLLTWSRKRGAPVGVRLVRGAYWEYEQVVAAQLGWPTPVFTQKWETDANFERLTTVLLENYPLLRPAFATHNIRSIAHAMALSQHLGVPQRALEFQMLYGMGDEVKAALVQMGQRVRVYAPYGEMIPGMGYLVRRLLENTSNESFLRQSWNFHQNTHELLRSPEEERWRQEQKQAAKTPPLFCPPAFSNEPELDFAREENRQAFAQALGRVRSELGQNYPLMIGTQSIDSREKIVSRNPSHPHEIVGYSARADREQAEAALAAAEKAFPSWRDTPPEERAAYLQRAAALMRQKRVDLAAWVVYEAGKGWREADADVCEAIDFLEYYSREMLRISRECPLPNLPGEANTYTYQPRGIAVVLAPWNFPLAILTGMTSAALVTGNVVVMKPAEQTPVVAAKLMEIFQAAKLPPGVLNYLPGIGEEAGEYLVQSPKVNLIAFTGSKAVGLRIYELAAKTREGQRGVKKVIAEMGGKNAIIVDDDADMDDAVLGTVVSAFGYAGQKCSACSRAIVLRPVYDLFLRRLCEATESLPIGPAEDPGAFVGPVIDEEARSKILRYIEIGKREGRLLLSREVPSEGYFVGPTIFADVSPRATIAQEEIFGPVLAVLCAQDFEEALEWAQSTPYALTGGLYSRSPAHIEKAKARFRVGNLYINRKITGARVGRQPFGGLGLSGIGSKAGGPDYLLQFMEPRSITENTLRRGFALLPAENNRGKTF